MLFDELLKVNGSAYSHCQRLIFAAEDAQFTPKECQQLAPHLINLAIQWRDEAHESTVVLSAIRTGASMLRSNEAQLLIPLLEPRHQTETTLVTLKMLNRIFEAQSPSDLDKHVALSREVLKIAGSLLNPYAIIASSKCAAMAQLATCTLAAMGSTGVILMVDRIRVVDVRWFTEQTMRELKALQTAWYARAKPTVPQVCKLLVCAIRELE